MKRSADLEEEQVTMSMGVAQEQIIEGFRIARVIRKHRAEASVAVMACISGGGGGSGTKCRTSRWWVGHFFSQKHS